MLASKQRSKSTVWILCSTGFTVQWPFYKLHGHPVVRKWSVPLSAHGFLTWQKTQVLRPAVKTPTDPFGFQVLKKETITLGTRLEAQASRSL